MKHSIRLLSLLVVGTWCASRVIGADAPPPNETTAALNTPKAQAIAHGPTNVAWERRLPNLTVDNLPLLEVAKTLTDEYPEVNFIVPEAAREAIVNITLRNVALQEILDAIELSSDGRIRALKRGNMVSFVSARTSSTQREAAVQCRVFRLAPYLEGKSEKDADAAIKSLYEALTVAWQMLKRYERNVEAPELTIHRETKLLIAVGREKELGVLEQVVRELQGSVVTSKVLPAAVPPADKPGTVPQKR